MEKPRIAHYLDEYVLEEGIERYFLDELVTVVCCIKGYPHTVITRKFYLSDKKKGTFAFCPIHNDFFYASIDRREIKQW